MKFLENLSIKGKIRLITLPLIGIAVVALGLLLYESVSNYIYTAQLNNANKVFDYILLSSAEQAKERGFTATMIGDPTITIQNSILQTRNQGDMYLDSALTLVNSMTLNSLSTQQLSLIKELREKRNTMRKNIDSYLGINAGTIEQRTAWVKAQTTLIRAEQKLAQTLFGSDEGLNTILEMNSQIKNSIFLVSEHAGLERATIGGVITAGTPIPVKTFENLMKYRGIVEENIQIVSQYAKNTAATPKIRQAIAQMDAKFLGEFEKLRKDVYAASASQSPYPVNTAEWVKKSTEAINSILTVSRCISDEVALIATEQKNNSISQSLIALLFFLIGIVGIFASFTIGSIINKAVVELTQTAHRVIDGDLTAQSKRISNDELGTLSTTFNIMTQTIEERVVGSQLMINTVIDMTSDKSTTDDALRAMLEGMKKLLHAQYGAVAIFDAKNSVKTFIPLHDVIENLKLYLELESLRFDQQFNYDFRTDDIDVYSIEMPSMLIQPYVENAIWHGLLKKNGEKNIHIKFFRSFNYLICEIEDNGIGRVKAGELNLKKQHKSLGTIITQEMFDTLHKIKDTDYSVEIIDLYDETNLPTGTKVIVRMELN